jgi:hypothetical protein
MIRKILRSSAKFKNWQWLIELHRSVINMLKIKGPRTEPCGTPEVTSNGKEVKGKAIPVPGHGGP